MSAIDSAKLAISKSNSDALIKSLLKLNKEQIQDLAKLYKATSANVHMLGSWVEKSKADLIDIDGNVVQKEIDLERNLKGELTQYYGSTSLHKVALLALDPNITEEFDEDYFSAGEMLFGEDYGFGADSVSFTADCKSEEKYINSINSTNDDFDDADCDADNSSYDIQLRRADVVARDIDIVIDKKIKISLPLKKSNHKVRWLIFSMLFMSSQKTLEDLNGDDYIVSDFMKEYFDISV